MADEERGSAPGGDQSPEQGSMVKAAKVIGSAIGKAASMVGVKGGAAGAKAKPAGGKRKTSAGASAAPKVVGKVDLSKRSKSAGKAAAKKSKKQAAK